MNKIFLISSDKISFSEIKQGSLALSSVWGVGLEEYFCEESSFEILNNLTEGNGLILLKGDSAQKYFGRESWLQALSDWSYPVIILTKTLISGETPGSVFAYSALCKELSIPLVGVLQVGGVWDKSKKVKDNLPWCGWIPSHLNEVLKTTIKNDYKMDIQEVVFNIRRKYFYMFNKNI